MSLEIAIPFPGFYESWLSQGIDSQLEYFVENEATERQKELPEWLRLTESEISEFAWEHMTYADSYRELAHYYLDSFDAIAGEALDETRAAWRNVWHSETNTFTKERYRADSMGLKFSDMTSPQYYNFETDRLFAWVSLATVKRLFAISKADDHDTLRRVIKERFTSRSGFISHYDNDLASWLSKPLAQWDHNELQTLLVACLELRDVSDIEHDATESALDSSGDYQAFEKGFDFDGFDSELERRHAARLVDYMESAPELAAQWINANPFDYRRLVESDPSLFTDLDELPDIVGCGAWYRCDKTPDMFQTLN